MKNIKFISSDFGRLSDIKNLNKEFYLDKKGDYKKGTDLKLIENKINKIQGKMRNIIPELKKLDIFEDFTIDICQNRKISNQYKKGKYREQSWIYIYDNNLFDYFKKRFKIKKYVHYYLPQIQVSINNDSFTTASIWFEPNSLTTWKETLNEFIIQNPIEDKKIYFSIYKNNKSVFNHDFEYATKKLSDEFLKAINAENSLKAGISIYYSKDDIIGKNIITLIKNDLLYLFEKYYRVIFKNYITKSKNREKINEGYKRRTRKESSAITIKKVFRKGTKGGIISQDHNKMKKGYKHYLEHLHKTKVSSEYMFIDLSVELKNKIILYEIKTDDKPHVCIRNGLGQLLFYAWQIKEETNKKIEINIIGKNAFDTDISDFIRFVKNKLGLDFNYIYFDFKSYNKKYNIK